MRKKMLAKVLAFLCMFALSVAGFAQNISVKGRVVDESGSPIAGATVAVRGTNQATSTNDNGAFTISAKNGATLRFSYIGLSSLDQTVSGSEVNVTLTKDSKSLNEVVVTALGIRKEKKALGYSITEVKGDELTQARTTNIANSLVGKVAGLNIASNVTGPSGSTRISIRGNTAISQNNQPLIVVDGVPISNESVGGSVGMWGGADHGDGMSSLNPDEIETVTVLKGGTAAALYGSRASNGAILITSKGGNRGQKGGVEFTSNFQLDDLLYKKYKDFQYEYGAGDNGLKPTSFDPNLNQTNSYGGKLDGSSIIQYDSVSRPYVAHSDNLSKFYNVGTTATNTIALTGGSEKISYRFSMSDLNNHGIVPNNTFRRDNVSLNLNSTVSSRLSMLLNVKYIKEKNKNRPRVSDSPGNANYTLATLPTSLDVETMKGSKYNTNGFEKVWSNNQYVQNPYFATEDYVQHDEKDRFIASFEPRFNLTDWLYLKARVGFDRFNFRNTDITPTGTGYQLGGGFASNTINFNESNNELLLGFNKKIISDINISAVGGGNLMKQTYNNDSYGGNPFNIPYFYDISNVSPASVTTRYNYIEKRINSVYGSADLSYKDLFFVNFSARNDWFSALAPGKNSIFYPAVGGSFILSQAIKLPDFVNYAKLRASWAQVGGGADPYQLSLTYGLSGATGGAPLAQINQTQVPNALLQPFVLTTSEIGYEGRMFNNRLGIDLALYTRNTTKDIVSTTISGASGYTTALFNVGKITNKGIELLLNYRAGSSRSFSWEPSFNAAYNKNEIVALYGDLVRIQVAEPRSRTVYVYQEVGRAFADIQGYAFKRDASGQVIFNKQGLPLSESLHKFGSGVSPWTLGFTNSFRYKGVGLSFLVDAKFGGYIYSGTNGLAYRYGLSKGTLPGRETGIVGQGVTEDGKANTVNVPAEAYYQNLYNNFAEPFVYSSDFVKLRQVIIDYTFPAKMFGRTPFKGLSLSLVGRNLWTIMKHTPNIDPESNYSASNAQGFEFVGLPSTRSLGINLNVKF